VEPKQVAEQDEAGVSGGSSKPEQSNGAVAGSGALAQAAEVRLAASSGVSHGGLLLAQRALAECEERRRLLSERFHACIVTGLEALAQRAASLLEESTASGWRCAVMQAERHVSQHRGCR